MCSGPRRAEPRVFVQAELLQELVPVALRGMFASVLDTQLREWWGDVVRELASRQPEIHLSLLELLRSKPDGLKQLLEILECKFSAVDSDAIRRALEHSNHRRNVAKQSLKLAVTREAVSEAFGETGAPVILRLPDSARQWKLPAILRKLLASGVIAWPAEPSEAWLKQLVEQVLRFMFRSEGGTIGCVFCAAPTATHPAAALTARTRTRIPRLAPPPRCARDRRCSARPESRRMASSRACASACDSRAPGAESVKVSSVSVLHLAHLQLRRRTASVAKSSRNWAMPSPQSSCGPCHAVPA